MGPGTLDVCRIKDHLRIIDSLVILWSEKRGYSSSLRNPEWTRFSFTPLKSDM